MIKYLFALLLSTLSIVKSTDPVEADLVHVFEVVRHGARAPLVMPPDSQGFPVQQEMLTPMGMRQRFLLGRYNWHRFGKLYYDGDMSVNIKNHTFAQSTLVYRTIQSGKAELMGMLHEHMKLGGRPYLTRPQWTQFESIDPSNTT